MAPAAASSWGRFFIAVRTFRAWRRSRAMKRYYFDIRDGDQIIPDEEGLELSTLEKVQEEAARSLADMARDAVRGQLHGTAQRIAIEVRDDTGPVLQVRFTFEVDRHRL
jgi:hypothetical protein